MIRDILEPSINSLETVRSINYNKWEKYKGQIMAFMLLVFMIQHFFFFIDCSLDFNAKILKNYNKW